MLRDQSGAIHIMRLFLVLGAAVGLWLFTRNVDTNALQSNINMTLANCKNVVAQEANAIQQKVNDTIGSLTQGSK